MKTLLKNLVFASTILFASCGSDDDTIQEEIPQELAPLVIDCSMQVEEGETRVLANRNGGIDYIINCSFIVNGDFIIDPDVTIQFGTDAGIIVTDTGSIQATGTAINPIIFKGENAVPGAWKGIYIESNNTNNALVYTQIAHAGGGAFNSNGDLGSVIVWADSRLNMSNTTITNSAAYGFNASYGGSELVLENNTITSCTAPFFLRAQYPSTLQGGTYTGNTTDAILVESYTSSINTESTWRDLGVPYHVQDYLQVVPGGKLTINPGVTIAFGLDAELFINEGASGPKPSLIAVGTAQNPILFTSINQVSGAWRGIRFDTPSALNEIGFATIEYASNANQSGAIYMWYDTVLNVHDVTFRDIQSCAFTTEDDPSLTTSNITYINVSNQFCEL